MSGEMKRLSTFTYYRHQIVRNPAHREYLSSEGYLVGNEPDKLFTEDLWAVTEDVMIIEHPCPDGQTIYSANSLRPPQPAAWTLQNDDYRSVARGRNK